MARPIVGLSGYPGSWLREAGNAGHPIGVVNDGDIAEPGTAAFLTEVGERTDAAALEIARQHIQGRPGFDDDDDADPVVIMGGGEELFFPEGTPFCTAEEVDAALSESADPVATIPANMAGVPGISIPGGLADGLPVGIQFLAPVREDARLYRAGAALEALLEKKWGGPLLASAPVLGGVK